MVQETSSVTAKYPHWSAKLCAIFAVFCFALAWLPLLQPQISSAGAAEAIWILSGFFGAASLLGWLDSVRSGVVADENGLEIRGTFRTQRFAWHEIENFYIRPMANNPSVKSKLRVVVARGRKFSLPTNYENGDALCDFIAQRATAAKSREWEILGAREILNTPQIFAYGKTRIWPIFLMGLVLGSYFGAQFLIGVVFKGGFSGIGNALTQFGSPQMNFLIISSMIILCLAMSSLAWLQIPALLTLRRFDGQKIVAGSAGLRWEKDAQTVEIGWDEIHWFGLERVEGHLQKPLCVVQSPRERIEFHSLLPNSFALRALIQFHARQSVTREWNFADGHDENSLLIESPRADGVRVFRYRTRNARAMLFFVAAISLGTLAQMIFGIRPIIPAFFAVMTAVFLLCAWGWLFYWKSRAEIGEDGISVFSPWTTQTLAWHEIEDLQKGAFFTIRGAKKRLRLLSGGFLDKYVLFEELVAQKSGKKWR